MERRMANIQSARTPIETPGWLQEQTRQQQASAHYCGLGFKISRLDEAVYRAVSDAFSDSISRFRPEAEIP